MKSFIFILATMMMVACVKADDFISIQQVFYSPNKVFEAKLCHDDQYYLQIKDAVSKTDYKFKGILTPVFSIKWTRDSKNVITIEHIAGGSTMSLIHFNGKTWKYYRIEPPGSGPRSYSVISQNLYKGAIKVQYQVADEAANGLSEAYHIYIFDVDPSNGNISNIHKHTIDADTYSVLNAK